MELLKIFRWKAPERYEDIAGYEGWAPNGLWKLLLILFLAEHPDEAERYNRDFEARMLKKLGKGLYDEWLASPREKVRELRSEMRKLRKGIRKEQREHGKILSELDTMRQTLNSGKEAAL
jgi:hypothetical protein